MYKKYLRNISMIFLCAFATFVYFKNDDVKNIAISGAYSAGKSSVLETYKKKHSNIKFLHISLAHFKSPMEKEDEEAEIEEEKECRKTESNYDTATGKDVIVGEQ